MLTEGQQLLKYKRKWTRSSTTLFFQQLLTRRTTNVEKSNTLPTTFVDLVFNKHCEVKYLTEKQTSENGKALSMTNQQN